MRTSLMTAALAVALTACGGGGGNSSPTPAAASTPPSITLSSASSQTLSGGKPVALSASVSSGDAVTWQLAAGAPGSLSAGSGASVNYIPPASVAAVTPVTVTASAGGASKSFSFTLFPDPGPAGLSRLAGAPGFNAILDGQGTQARFKSLRELAFDAAGNAYVVDGGSIRKISADGAVTTLARETDSTTDGDRTTAMLGHASAVAPAPDGSVYVIAGNVQGGSNKLRKISQDGSIATISTLPLLNDFPGKLVAGKSGWLYAALSPYQISRISPTGAISVLAGSAEYSGSPQVDGKGGDARIVTVWDMALQPDGSLLFLDAGTPRMVTPDGVVTTLALKNSAGETLPATGIVSLTVTGNDIQLLFYREQGIYDVERYTLKPSELQRVSSTRLAVTAPAYPSLLRDQGNGQLVLTTQGAVRRLTAAGAAPWVGLEDDTVKDIDGPAAVARFLHPVFLTADLNGNVVVVNYTSLVADNSPHRYPVPHGLSVRKISPGGDVSTLYTNHDFENVTGAVQDKSGNIYVSEGPKPNDRFGGGGAIYKISPTGTMTVLVASNASEQSGSPSMIDGPPGTATFYLIALAGIDADGNLYLRDNSVHFRKVTPAGIVSTIASLPSNLNVAPDGYIYTLEGDNPTVYRTTPDGIRSEVTGATILNGTGTPAKLSGVPSPTVLVPTGLYSFAAISGHTIVRLVVPH